MGKGRLEAFSVGVLAIIITIMVLEMKVPHGENLMALQPLLSVFLSYVLIIHLALCDRRSSCFRSAMVCRHSLYSSCIDLAYTRPPY
jgi:hypothetical protein